MWSSLQNHQSLNDAVMILWSDQVLMSIYRQNGFDEHMFLKSIMKKIFESCNLKMTATFIRGPMS